jgi:nanoRNase/pAp phosphatase (c-di-AMP/oligoRNAs hydrolase)
LHTTGTSTAELLYRLFCEKRDVIPQKLCENLLLGILGDTAWFGVNMAPDHSYILNFSERLMRDGNINLELFKSRFRGYSERAFYIIQELVRNAEFSEIEGWPRFMHSHISSEYVIAKGLTDEDLKEGCDIYVGTFGKSMTDVLWGFIFYPTPKGDVKVSLRSRPGGVNVREFAQSMGIGGGHNGASGMTIAAPEGQKLSPKEQLTVLTDWMRTHEPPVYDHD